MRYATASAPATIPTSVMAIRVRMPPGILTG